jgi:hypothetical protein
MRITARRLAGMVSLGSYFGCLASCCFRSWRGRADIATAGPPRCQLVRSFHARSDPVASGLRACPLDHAPGCCFSAFTFLIGCGLCVLCARPGRPRLGRWVPAHGPAPRLVALNSDGIQHRPERRACDRRRQYSGVRRSPPHYFAVNGRELRPVTPVPTRAGAWPPEVPRILHASRWASRLTAGVRYDWMSPADPHGVQMRAVGFVIGASAPDRPEAAHYARHLLGGGSIDLDGLSWGLCAARDPREPSGLAQLARGPFRPSPPVRIGLTSYSRGGGPDGAIELPAANANSALCCAARGGPRASRRSTWRCRLSTPRWVEARALTAL